MHITIKSPENSLVGVDDALLLAWIFKEDIMKKENDFIKNGGKFIIPIPKIKIIDKKNYKKIN